MKRDSRRQIIAGAALVGLLLALASPAPKGAPLTAPPSVPLSQTLQTAALWLAIWIGPLLLLSALFGRRGLGSVEVEVVHGHCGAVSG